MHYGCCFNYHTFQRNRKLAEISSTYRRRHHSVWLFRHLWYSTKPLLSDKILFLITLFLSTVCINSSNWVEIYVCVFLSWMFFSKSYECSITCVALLFWSVFCVQTPKSISITNYYDTFDWLQDFVVHCSNKYFKRNLNEHKYHCWIQSSNCRREALLGW